MLGKTVMVTGGTAGIGLVTARELARMGAHVVIVSRNQQKGERVVRELRRATGNEWIAFQRADLSSLDEIRRVARNFAEEHARLDVLVNNAGAFFQRRQESADGIEMTFALNHLSYFLLTNLLLDRLRAADGGRIVNVSSRAHVGAELDFADLEMKRGYKGWVAYRRSKLANIHFTRALARRLEGTGVSTNALHPGFVATNFGLNNSLPFRIGMKLAFWTSAIGVEEGAQTPIHLASSPEVEGVTGRYFVKCADVQPSPAAGDDGAAERLWEVSERMTGVRTA